MATIPKFLSFLSPNRIEAGLDEAGRGCLAGPVFAAAVVLPPDFHHPLLNDCKKINHITRLILAEFIKLNALDFAIASVPAEEIDRINILQASLKAMHLATDQLLKVRPDHLIVDGNRFIPYPEIGHTTIVGGDGKMASIAAASILAKTSRDAYMDELALLYPEYGWDKNRAYPTQQHRKAIALYGPTEFHRKSFKLL